LFFAKIIAPFPSMNSTSSSSTLRLSNDPIPFPSPGEFTTARSKIILKPNLDQTLPNAFGVNIVDAIRVTQSLAEVNFEIELRQDRYRQKAMCGLMCPEFIKGMAVAIDPNSGEITDILNGAGVLGYITPHVFLPNRPFKCELRVQKFGRNHICSVQVEGESIIYPAFLGDEDPIFNAVVGADVSSGSTVSYRNAKLAVKRIAKVA